MGTQILGPRQPYDKPDSVNHARRRLDQKRRDGVAQRTAVALERLAAAAERLVVLLQETAR